MTIERERLVSIIEFTKETARLRRKPVATVAEHKIFALFEHELQGLPGIQLNTSGVDDDDDIWISVERLHETRPPEIESARLRPWVEMEAGCTTEPTLRKSAAGGDIAVAGIKFATKNGGSNAAVQASVALDECADSDFIQAEFEVYVETQWRPWARQEALRERAIRIYTLLFKLKHQLEGAFGEEQLELVWGVGMGILQSAVGTVSYPIISRLVELSLNAATGTIDIRPRDVEPRLELNYYTAVDNPGVDVLEKAAKEFFSSAVMALSPFERSTFEPVLRSAASNLDARGVYLPDHQPVEDRSIPAADAHLKVTDTWVLFARPRSNDIFLQDLDKLKGLAESAEEYPGAVAAIVTDPGSDNPTVELPSFRGASAYTGVGGARDLYFPKVFNDEQIRIVQMLEVSDGVVVQGPPGTGKTHTIANVICHYLAEGKRVLVTSMKDPALRVLQQQLPPEIRPLAISLLTSERDGMRQFEYAIEKIASEIQSLDRAAMARSIKKLGDYIDVLHGKLASADFKIADWAKRNLAKITLDDAEIDPLDAAQEVVRYAGEFDLIPDALGIGPEFAPQFSDADMMRLREARRTLGRDIDYLGASLPQLIDFPDSQSLLEIHHDHVRLEELRREAAGGAIPALADSGQSTLALAQQLLGSIESLHRLRDEIAGAGRTWTAGVQLRLRADGQDKRLLILDALGADLEQAANRQSTFLERPVQAPPGAEVDAELLAAAHNLANDKSPFGLVGMFKADKKKELAAIHVLGKPPVDAKEWRHVADYMEWLRQLRGLASRWNAIAGELQMERVTEDQPASVLDAAQSFGVYMKVKSAAQTEAAIRDGASRVFPSWPHAREVSENPQRLDELEGALRHHLARGRLANVWAAKERFQAVLNGRSGRVIEDIRTFLADTLGNPDVDDAHVQAEWSARMAELSRVLGLGTELSTAREVTEQIRASGAGQYATLLTTPSTGTVDPMVPDNWRQVWRLRRLATHLQSIDSHDVLKELARVRREAEDDLARSYRDMVVSRTWLKLAENATPRTRQALMAYLVAVKKIGKGTGKRAVGYRRDARAAAAQANPAVPCWIMPHYRVSESLPAELGCFDLVIIDEASQSDLAALPALLRTKKALIVGDDRQVSPEGVGLDEDRIQSLMSRFLTKQVGLYRSLLSPARSVYDLFKVVFAENAIMLKEHFRCVGPIIEYSKREFYNHEIRPLRLPKASERLDPPLVDVLVEDGYRDGDINHGEASFIVDEIKRIVEDSAMRGRTVGVVSLLADKQAREIWDMLTDEIGPTVMQEFEIECGDARTFQGKERDIMFLSMVVSSGNARANSHAMFEQRYNVAASRARDRMYLVRSVGLEQLSAADGLRRGLIEHFASPFQRDPMLVEDLRQLCESPFERELYDELTGRGFAVTPQVEVGKYRIDMVVEGIKDDRIAIECDGDRYHGADRWEEDRQRQRILERAGWTFWRCFASAFVTRRQEMLNDLLETLAAHGIEPSKGGERKAAMAYTEHRVVNATNGPTPVDQVDHIEPAADSPVSSVP